MSWLQWGHKAEEQESRVRGLSEDSDMADAWRGHIWEVEELVMVSAVLVCGAHRKVPLSRLWQLSTCHYRTKVQRPLPEYSNRTTLQASPSSFPPGTHGISPAYAHSPFVILHILTGFTSAAPNPVPLMAQRAEQTTCFKVSHLSKINFF